MPSSLPRLFAVTLTFRRSLAPRGSDGGVSDRPPSLPRDARELLQSRVSIHWHLISEQKIPLRHGQHIRRFTPEQYAVGFDLVGLWVDIDVG